MTAREEQHRSKRRSEDELEQDAKDVRERQEKLDEDVDAVLDEIDAVLETNSEEFVRGFVQKGGE